MKCGSLGLSQFNVTVFTAACTRSLNTHTHKLLTHISTPHVHILTPQTTATHTTTTWQAKLTITYALREWKCIWKSDVL